MALHFKGIPKSSVGQTQSCEIVHTLSKYYAATLLVCHFKSLGSLSRVCCRQPLVIEISLQKVCRSNLSENSVYWFSCKDQTTDPCSFSFGCTFWGMFKMCFYFRSHVLRKVHQVLLWTCEFIFGVSLLWMTSVLVGHRWGWWAGACVQWVPTFSLFYTTTKRRKGTKPNWFCCWGENL